MSRILRLPAVAIEAVARGIKLTNHMGGATTAWVPNEEQVKAWGKVSSGRWIYFAKPRQIGLTTALQFFVMLWCVVNDRAGNRVRAGLYVDTDKKLSEREAFAKSVVAQLPDLFGGCDVNSERVRFPNGSELVFATGSGSGEGRSGSFQLLLLSEFPFWKVPTTYGALIPALSIGGQVLIDTTIDVTAPNGELAKALWRDETNAYERVFFPVEEHGEYRADPQRITDDEWAECQADHGFTVRGAAAWWLAEALPNICAGDVSRLMREYPQIEAHLWVKAKGRFIPVTSQIVVPIAHLDCAGTPVPIWRHFKDTSKQLIVSVDTGKGVEKDRSAVIVMDKANQFIVAAFSSASLDAFEFGDIVAALLKHHSEASSENAWGVVTPAIKPDLVVEENGIGEAMVLHIRSKGHAVITKWTDEGSKGTGLTAAKTAIVARRCYGPKDLAEECDDLHQHPDTGAFKGRKDMIMAIGFALLHLQLAPYKPPTVAVDPRRIDGKKLIRARMGGGNADW